MIELPRRRFLAGLGAFLAAPTIVKAGSLMKVKPIDPAAYLTSTTNRELTNTPPIPYNCWGYHRLLNEDGTQTLEVLQTAGVIKSPYAPVPATGILVEGPTTVKNVYYTTSYCSRGK